MFLFVAPNKRILFISRAVAPLPSQSLVFGDGGGYAPPERVDSNRLREDEEIINFVISFVIKD